ncbi:MAG: flagellar biosynthetic protein FliQ [Bdellovibrionota bacterium]
MEQELLFAGIRALFIIAIPIILVAALVGILAAAFQTSTALRDPIISYSLKLSAIAVLLYLMLPSFVRTMISLTESALQV